MAKELRGGRLKPAVDDIAGRVENGETLADALEARGREFPPLYVHLIRAGIASGNLSGVLVMLTRHVTAIVELRRRVTEYAVYPAALAAFGVLLTGWIALVTVPRYVEMYEDLGVQMPTLTIWASRAASDGWLVGSGALAVLAVAFLAVRLLRRTRPGQVALERVLLTVPAVGGLLRALWTARFCNTLALLLRSNIPLPTSFGLIAEATGSALARQLTEEVAHRTAEGVSFGEALAGSNVSTVFFTNSAHLILSAGDESGDLASALEHSGAAAEARVDNCSRTIQSLVPVVFALATGLLVVVLVCAMILPFFSLLGHCAG